jgi:voltage-gated potassium channel
MDERSERIARRFDAPMFVAALLVIPMLVLYESNVGPGWKTVADVLNWGTWLAFVTETVVMLTVVPDRGRWIRDHPIDFAVTILTPPVLPTSLAAARGLRLLRVLRVLRLLRLAPLARRVFTLDGVRYAALLAFLAVVAGGTAFAAIEKEPTEWDGIWWAVTTMTTVGYGDIYPRTDAGRVLAMALMVVGIGFGSLIIGAVAERFAAPGVQAEVEEVEDEIQSTEDDLLRELRELGERMRRVEAAVERSRRSTDEP